MISPRVAVSIVATSILIGALGAITPATALEPTPGPRVDDTPQVLAISIDALNPVALRELGHQGAPNLWRLVDQGASTLNARTQFEQTVTLPNHTSMVTGRRIEARRGGHGVTWNDDLPGHPATVQEAAGHGVASVFSVAHAHGRTTALYAAKTKFSLWDRSWPAGIDSVVIKDEQDGALVRAARRDLIDNDRAFTFLHLGNADKTGHAHGFMGKKYLAAVKRIDTQLGLLLRAVDNKSELADLTIILTADHGGPKGKRNHSERTLLADYRVPFLVWGPGIDHQNLYTINPRYRAPGTTRPDLRGRQPVRNGNVANVALGLLGLNPVPGSLFGADDPLRLVAG